jgi:hypothetical protein
VKKRQYGDVYGIPPCPKGHGLLPELDEFRCGDKYGKKY